MRSDDDRSLFGDEPDEPTLTGGLEGVRISGATPASADPLADWNFDEASAPADLAAPEMPHWTDEPTGQIPASLIRDGSDEPVVAAPVWREDTADWWADEESFDPILLGAEEEPRGALNLNEAVEETRPWEFDLDDVPLGGTSRSSLEDEETRDDEASVGGDEKAPWDLSDDEFVYVPVVPAAPRQRGGRRVRGVDETPSDDVPRERTASPRRTRSDEASARSDRDMRTAVLTGILIAVLVLVTFNIGTVLAMLLVVVVVTLAAAEAFAAFRRAGYHPATLLGLVATVSLLIGSYNRGPQALGLVFALLFVFTVIWFLAGVEKADSLKGLTSTLLVFAWVGLLGSYAALLLNPTDFPHRHGLAFLLAAIILAVAYDVAALFVGRSMGRRPLAPEISPNKTIEGAVGATVVTILVSVIVVPMIHPWTMASALSLGIAVSILSPLGDLAESMIKRNLGLKDMGRLLPGHGGLLDRVDGLLFVLPATYYLVKAFNLA